MSQHCTKTPDTTIIPNQSAPHDISDLDLSVRAYNTLRRANINTVEQLIQLSEVDLKIIRNLGEKIMLEIKYRLANHGLSLQAEPSVITEPMAIDIIRAFLLHIKYANSSDLNGAEARSFEMAIAALSNQKKLNEKCQALEAEVRNTKAQLEDLSKQLSIVVAEKNDLRKIVDWQFSELKAADSQPKKPHNNK